MVPCHNEAERLAKEQFLSFAHQSRAQLVFVNDGSTDRTDRILDELVNAAPDKISAIRLDIQAGKGEAVRAGLRAAISKDAEVVAYLDADLSTPLGELERLLDVQDETGADGVLGSRVGLLGHDVHRSPSRHYLGRIFATAASFVLDLQIYDTQCGAKIFRVSPALEQALASPFRTRWVFDVELIARLQSAEPGIRLVEVPLQHWHDVGGSKLTAREMLIAARDLFLISRYQRKVASERAADDMVVTV